VRLIPGLLHNLKIRNIRPALHESFLFSVVTSEAGGAGEAGDGPENAPDRRHDLDSALKGCRLRKSCNSLLQF